MLDVHPPHQPAHTWKDFFIHIATIVVGLLIAVGLEQTVEYIHHQRQVAETNRDLQHERVLNRQRYQLLEENLDQFAHNLKQEAELITWIRQHPHAPHAQLPPHPSYIAFPSVPYSDSAWQTALGSGVFDYMSPHEVKADHELYALLQRINTAQDQLTLHIARLRGVAIEGPLEQQTPAQLDEAWKDLKEVRIRSAIIISLQHSVVVRYPDFPSDTPFFGVRGLFLNEVHHLDDVDEWEQAMKRLNAIDIQDDKE